MPDVVEPGVRRVEKSTPQWIYKDQILFCLEQARIPYSKVKTDLKYNPQRVSAYEKELSEAIDSLWGLLGAKVNLRILKAKEKHDVTGYEQLTALDDFKTKPTEKQLLQYFMLLTYFVEDLGITKIEEETYKIAPSHKILHGFVKDK